MQSTVTKRVGSTRDVTTADQQEMDLNHRNLDDDVNDLLDDNNIDRILSRPSPPRRKLDIYEAPEFVHRLSGYLEASVGDSVTFSGQYTAFPKPTVKWFKDEEEVSETPRHNVDLSSEAEGIVRLIISELIRQDEGAYKCKVENQEGVASTTGYLSVSGKSSDKGQKKKLGAAQDRGVSTAPYLRPIVEQRSMEEREEREYERLPPSPLQQFMDNIRHGAKSMHGGPIVYADLDEVYPDDDVIRDFGGEEEDDDEEDVFDEECSDPTTPSASPVNELPVRVVLHLPRDTAPLRRESPTSNGDTNAQVRGEFLTPSRTVPMATTTQVSNADSAYDSSDDTSQDDGQQTPVPLADDGVTLDGPEAKGVTLDRPEAKSVTLQSTGADASRRQNRRLKLTLQRSQAIELSETDDIAQNHLTATGAELAVDRQTAPDAERRTDGTGSRREAREAVRSTHEPAPPPPASGATLCGVEVSRRGRGRARRSAADEFFSLLDSPWVQFFTGFAMSALVVALAADISPLLLVPIVALFSFAGFVVLDRHLVVELRSKVVVV